MHEYSIVQALVERVAQAAAERGAISVGRVSVRIGELSGVEAELLHTAYLTYRERTICAHAPLDIALVRAAWACRECGVNVPTGGVLRCAACGGPATLRHGDEIMLDRIEMEVA